jgi:Flp pilus assembly protein TadD
MRRMKDTVVTSFAVSLLVLSWGCTGLGMNPRVEDPIADLLARGQREFKEGQGQTSLQTFSRAIEMAPHTARAWNARGFVHSQLHYPVQAIDDFKTAVSLDPKPLYLNNLGVAYLEQSKPSDSLSAFDQAVRLSPDVPLFLIHRALAYRHLDKLNEAESDLSHALELDDRNATAYANRAVIFALQQNYEAAKRDLDQAVRLNSSLKEVYESRALIQLLTGHPDQAVTDFSRAVLLGASDTLIYHNRAVAYALLGQTHSAERDYARACGRGFAPACSGNRLLVAASNPRR